MVPTLLLIARKTMRLETYINAVHLDNMGKIIR